MAAPAACCCKAVPCAVRFLPGQDVPQYENKIPKRLLPNINLMRRASAKRESGDYCGRSSLVPTRRGCRLSHECWMPLNPTDITAVAGHSCEFMLQREAGCTLVRRFGLYCYNIYICAVAPKLCRCSCGMLLQSCAVCCAFLLGQDVAQNVNKVPTTYQIIS